MSSVPVATADRRAWQDDLLRHYVDAARVPDWALTAYRRTALFLAFNLVRNVPVFDLTNRGAAALLFALLERGCAAVEDTDALDLLGLRSI